MFAVFQFFHLIQYEIFQTTASMGPFMLPHAVCAVIVIIFVSSILAPDNTLKSDDQILHVDDPPNQLGLRTPSSTETKPRQQQHSNALQRIPTKLISHISTYHPFRSTRSSPVFPPTIQEFKALLDAVPYVSYSIIPGPQILLHQSRHAGYFPLLK